MDALSKEFPRSLYRRYNNKSQKHVELGYHIERLFSAEPARDTALRLGNVLLDGAVEVIHLFQGVGLSLLRIGLGLALRL